MSSKNFTIVVHNLRTMYFATYMCTHTNFNIKLINCNNIFIFLSSHASVILLMQVKTIVNLESNQKEEVEKCNLDTGNIHANCRMFSPWESIHFYTGKKRQKFFHFERMSISLEIYRYWKIIQIRITVYSES